MVATPGTLDGAGGRRLGQDVPWGGGALLAATRRLRCRWRRLLLGRGCWVQDGVRPRDARAGSHRDAAQGGGGGRCCDGRPGRRLGRAGLRGGRWRRRRLPGSCWPPGGRQLSRLGWAHRLQGVGGGALQRGWWWHPAGAWGIVHALLAGGWVHPGSLLVVLLAAAAAGVAAEGFGLRLGGALGTLPWLLHASVATPGGLPAARGAAAGVVATLGLSFGQWRRCSAARTCPPCFTDQSGEPPAQALHAHLTRCAPKG